MGNYLKVDKKQQVIALLQLGWSYRRIEAETGVRRETVSRYDPRRPPKPATVFPGSEGDSEASSREFEGSGDSNPAKAFPGSAPKAAKVFPGSTAPPRSSAAIHHDEIVHKIEKQRLSMKRVWQDLVEDYGYAYSYESVKRYVRGLKIRRPLVGVMHCEAGEEAQVDFFRGVPTFDPQSGQWRRPWVFRMTLCCSRHGYEEAVWDQKLESFLRLHEEAFLDFEGVPKVIRHDNVKAAVVRACLYDPDVNTLYLAFAEHWGFTPLPTRPRNPKENGKQERSGGYVKDNAMKGRRFGSLDELNQSLRRWNRTIARLRIHGTTRKQVWSHFLETDKPALQALALERFSFFDCGTRGVHPDAHVEVEGAFYPVPTTLLYKDVQVRWDQKFVGVYYSEGDAEPKLVASHLRVGPGQFAPEPGKPPITSSQKAYVAKLLGRCERVGPSLRAWADAAYEERGVRALRLMQGVLGLTRKHSREAVLWAAERARERQLFRYQDFRRLVERAHLSPPRQLSLLAEHPDIRSMEDYRLEDWS